MNGLPQYERLVFQWPLSLPRDRKERASITKHLMNETLEALDRLDSGQEGSTANRLAIRFSMPRRMHAGAFLS